jgi:hypothetical protein
MTPDLNALEPPGEDTLDLPESLGWFVAACTWLRQIVLAAGETPPGTRLRALSAIRAESA